MAISGDTAARPASASKAARRSKRQQHLALTLDLFERNDIEQAVDMLLDLLDAADGDTDLEETGTEDGFMAHEADGPGCPIADPDFGVDDNAINGSGDLSYIEWQTRGRHKLGGYGEESLARNQFGYPRHEDDEDDDPDQCLAQEDIGTDHRARYKMGFGGDSGYSDPEGDFCLAGEDRIVAGAGIGGGGRCDDTGPGDTEDAENDQMTGNVPMPPVHSLEPNVFNGEREYLGHANLMTSFRANGDAEIRSADSGRRHRPVPASGWANTPGEPV